MATSKEVTLRWDADEEAFFGKVALADGTRIELLVRADGPRDTATRDRRLAAARDFCAGKLDAVRLACAKRLVAIYNREWRDGGATLTAAGLAERFTLQSLDDCGDGTYEVGFADGGLFAGHLVLATVESSGRVSDATLAG